MKKKIFSLVLLGAATFSLASCDVAPKNENAVITMTDENGNDITQEVKPTEDPDIVAKTVEAILEKATEADVKDYAKMTTKLNVKLDTAFEIIIRGSANKSEVPLEGASLKQEESTSQTIPYNIKLDVSEETISAVDYDKLEALTENNKVSDIFNAFQLYTSGSIAGKVTGEDTDGSHIAEIDFDGRVFNNGPIAYMDIDLNKLYADDRDGKSSMPFDNGSYYLDFKSILEDNEADISISQFAEMISSGIEEIMGKFGADSMEGALELGSQAINVEALESLDAKTIVEALGITIKSVNGENVVFNFKLDGDKLYELVNNLGVIDTIISLAGDADDKASIEYIKSIVRLLFSTFDYINGEVTVNAKTAQLVKFSLNLGDFVKNVLPLVFTYLADGDVAINITSVTFTIELDVKYEANFPSIDTAGYQNLYPIILEKIQNPDEPFFGD